MHDTVSFSLLSGGSDRRCVSQYVAWYGVASMMGVGVGGLAPSGPPLSFTSPTWSFHAKSLHPPAGFLPVLPGFFPDTGVVNGVVSRNRLRLGTNRFRAIPSRDAVSAQHPLANPVDRWFHP